jgi:hypothetical protein
LDTVVAAVQCQEPASERCDISITHGKLKCEGKKYQQKCIVECEPNFIQNPKMSSIFCMANGSWNTHIIGIKIIVTAIFYKNWY